MVANMTRLLLFFALVSSCQSNYTLNFKFENIDTIQVYKIENGVSELVEQFYEENIIKEFVDEYVNKSSFEIVKFMPDYEIKLETKSQTYTILAKSDLLKYEGRSYRAKSRLGDLINKLKNKED